MITVREMFRGVDCNTRIWISDSVVKEIRELDGRERPIVMKRLQRYAVNGFWNHQKEGGQIKHEWDQVYRIAFELIRLIGFYEDESKTDFILVDAFKKPGQNLTAPQRMRIDKVAQIRRQKQWTKVQS